MGAHGRVRVGGKTALTVGRGGTGARARAAAHVGENARRQWVGRVAELEEGCRVGAREVSTERVPEGR